VSYGFTGPVQSAARIPVKVGGFVAFKLAVVTTIGEKPAVNQFKGPEHGGRKPESQEGDREYRAGTIANSEIAFSS
jgi:hypothetical protein